MKTGYIWLFSTLLLLLTSYVLRKEVFVINQQDTYIVVSYFYIGIVLFILSLLAIVLINKFYRKLF